MLTAQCSHRRTARQAPINLTQQNPSLVPPPLSSVASGSLVEYSNSEPNRSLL